MNKKEITFGIHLQSSSVNPVTFEDLQNYIAALQSFGVQPDDIIEDVHISYYAISTSYPEYSKNGYMKLIEPTSIKQRKSL